MRSYSWLQFICFVSLAACAGCGAATALNIEKDLEVAALGGDNIKSVIISAPKKDQKVTVLVRTNQVPVNVYMVPERDLDAVQEKLSNQEALATPPLAKLEKSQEGTLEASVTGGTGFAVVVVNPGSKPAKVALKISGK